MSKRQGPSLGKLPDPAGPDDSVRAWPIREPLGQLPFGSGREPIPEAGSESRLIVWLALIIVGTAVGGLIAYFAARWYETRQLEAAMQQFTRTLGSVSAQSQREFAAAQERARSQAAAERVRAERENEARAAAKQRAAEAEAVRIAAAKAEADRREAAWKKFYVPSEICKNPDNRVMMECANAHAKAKKEFDKRWAAGQL